MAKQKKGKAGKSAPAPPRTSNRLYQGILAVAAVGAMVAIYFFGGRDSSGGGAGLTPSNPDGLTTSNPALRNRLILPAVPQSPRPITLAPELFTEPEIRQSYQAAKDHPEVLETVACYCGCYAESRHRNNLDCYKDNHGIT